MTISLEFLGAAGGVTGSRTLLTSGSNTFLVDCGLFQGPKDVRAKNREVFLAPGRKVDAVILTHAHLDHSGYLPRFHRDGFRGPIYTSEGTADLLPVLLSDAAHLEEEFAKYANKSGYSSHIPAIPLFTQNDVDEVVKLIRPIPRNQWIQVDDHLSFRFISAGHIIGASMVQWAIAQDNATRLLTFSGDLGHDRMLTMRPPADLLETDALVLESTYGDRLHPREDTVTEFAAIAKRTFDRKGVLVIPAFAVGRAQEILYIIRVCEDRDLIPRVPVILDSPMANEATRIFFAHPEDHRAGAAFQTDSPEQHFLPEHFGMTVSTDESMLACMKDGPSIVISAAGMLNGGRILHHLKARLPHEENTVLFCGYQAEGTKGRFLQDNAAMAETLRIHHTEVPINAEISTIASLSAHADWQDMMQWLGKMQKPPFHIILNHGDPDAMLAFEGRLKKALPHCKISTMVEPGKINLF